MQPGPPPKPVEQAKREGVAPSRIPNPPLRSSAETPEPVMPDDLNAYQAKAWREIVEMLTELDILDSADMATVEAAAAMLGRMREARRSLNAGDMIETTSRGANVPSPYWRIEKDAAQQVQRLLAELGLSPTARARLANSGAKSKKPEERLDGILGPSPRLRAVGGSG